MTNWKTLILFEYKKMLQKKSSLILLASIVFLVIFSCYGTLLGTVYVDGVPTETYLEAMKTDRGYSRALSGRTIDSTLLLEMSAAYQKITSETNYSQTPEYHRYARPYSSIYLIAHNIYRKTYGYTGLEFMSGLTKKQADDFYDVRMKRINENINTIIASADTKAYLTNQSSQVKTPFTYEYIEGYSRFFTVMYTNAALVYFAIAILLAPLFSGEYVSKTDQLILASRYGKKTLITAKLFTGLTIAAGLSLLLCALTYFTCMFCYGFDGANAPFQLDTPLSIYSLTIGQTAFLHLVCLLFGAVLVAAVTMILSAKMKTPFGVIIFTGILIIVPMFISDPHTNALLSNLLCLLPTNMTATSNIVSYQLFELPGTIVRPYIAMPAIAGIIALLSLPFTYRGFKNHQIR